MDKDTGLLITLLCIVVLLAVISFQIGAIHGLLK